MSISILLLKAKIHKLQTKAETKSQKLARFEDVQAICSIGGRNSDVRMGGESELLLK
jgi:hypothetical protein